MRLIDADKLYPDRMTKDGLAISQSQIANAPTVEERPHGEWIYEGVCSICGERCDYHLSGTIWIDRPANYCPNCGARMKEGDEK